jgi:hypothetical protein
LKWLESLAAHVVGDHSVNGLLSSDFSFDNYQFSVMLHNCFRESGDILEELIGTTMKAD